MTEAPQPPAAPAPVPSPSAPPSKRPGGLTALAVLNFVFGGLGVIGSILVLSAFLASRALGPRLMEIGQRAAESARDAEGARAFAEEATKEPTGAGTVYLIFFIGLVAAALLIVAGVGYIKQSRTSGYVVGHVYAILAILNVILNLAVVGAGFGFFVVIGLAYPIITLALLNTSFKKCFT